MVSFSEEGLDGNQSTWCLDTARTGGQTAALFSSMHLKGSRQQQLSNEMPLGQVLLALLVAFASPTPTFRQAEVA